MFTTPIFLLLRMHIGLTKLLEDGASNANFNAKRKFRPGFTGFDWDKRCEIERAIAADKDNEDEEDPREKKRRLKREKQRQKRVAKAKTC